MKMTRQISYVILISGALFISACHSARIDDWTSELTRNINHMTNNINDQIQRFTQQLNTQIDHTIRNNLQSTLAQVDETLRNLPRDTNGRIIKNDSTIIINNGNGISRSIVSGRTPAGEPYIRDIEERQVGDILYHNETSYNPKTKAMERIRWKLDLATPGAKPEILTDEE